MGGFMLQNDSYKIYFNPSVSLEFKPNTADDPQMKMPNISNTKPFLNCESKVLLAQGLPHIVSVCQKAT
jgi:UDP-glucuronate decarboxylase